MWEKRKEPLNLEEYYEKLKNLTEHGQREVCLFINFMEYYESNLEGERKCFVKDAEKKSK